MTAVLRTRRGEVVPLAVGRWVTPSSDDEELVLRRAVAPVLDVGCGPGRHVIALGRRGVMALGVDVSAHAVDMARSKGAMVLHRSIFDRLPGAGRWGSALLLDGNIGIGGDPAVLLGRLTDLVRPGGLVLAEVGPPGSPTRCVQVRIETAETSGPWFDWAQLGIDDADRVGRGAGLDVEQHWSSGSRWFVAWRR